MFSKLFILSASALAVCAAFVPMQAVAQVEELRFGIAEFDEEILNFDGGGFRRGDETSIAVSGEILFEEPKFLKWAFSPQPYIGGSLNLEGETSFGGAGLLWRQTVGKKFYGDFAFGVVAHTGTLEIKPTNEEEALLAERANEFETFGVVSQELRDAIRIALDARIDRELEEIEFGTRVLFRLQGAIGYNVSDDWAGEIYLEHLSNGRGNIFADDVNEGANSVGVRAVRKF